MNPVYFAIYGLLQKYLYGAGAELTADMELTLVQLSTVLSLLAAVMPFLVVFFIIRAVFGR